MARGVSFTEYSCRNCYSRIFGLLTLSFWCFRNINTSNRGAQFTSHLFKNFVKQFGIQHNFTTSWHPCANSLIERLHHHLKGAIMAHCDIDWVKALPLVLLGIRSTFKEDIKATSTEMVYGKPFV